MSAMSLLLESTLKSSIVVVIALAVAALLRRRSAAVRHWILASAIVCAALTPALGSVVPSWHVAIGGRRSVATRRGGEAGGAPASLAGRPSLLLHGDVPDVLPAREPGRALDEGARIDGQAAATVGVELGGWRDRVAEAAGWHG